MFHPRPRRLMAAMSRLHRLAVAAATVGLVHGAEILFIGNSFTFGGNERSVERFGGVPAMVEAIARACGETATVRMLAEPGKSWEFHLRRAETGAALAERDWSHVVLQEYSTRPTVLGDPAGFRRDGERFYQAIRRAAPRAKVVLYQTWARAAAHSIYADERLEDPDAMHDQLLEAYAALERHLEDLEPGKQILRAPVGTGFARHLRVHPADRVHGEDLYHASEEGSYLAALMISGTIFGLDPQIAPHRFGEIEIDPAAADRLKETAAVYVGPQAGEPRHGLVPSYPIRLWFPAGEMARQAPMFRHATAAVAAKADPRALDELGKAVLEVGPRVAAHPANERYGRPFLAAGTLAGRSRAGGDPSFHALWLDGPPRAEDSAIAAGGGTDLVVLAATGSWDETLERMEKLAEQGLARVALATIRPFGDGGVLLGEEALRRRMGEIRRRFPESPGIAFDIAARQDLRSHRDLIALCDRLSAEFWPASPLPDGVYTLALQSDPRRRLGLVDGAPALADAPGATDWQVERIAAEVYRLRPLDGADGFLVVTADGPAVVPGPPEATAEWRLEPAANGYRIAVASDTRHALSLVPGTRTPGITPRTDRASHWAFIPRARR